jgi:cell division protein FtsL
MLQDKNEISNANKGVTTPLGLRKRIVLIVIVLMTLSVVIRGYISQRTSEKEDTERKRAEMEGLLIEAAARTAVAEKAMTEAEMKARDAEQDRVDLEMRVTVECPSCFQRLRPEENKAPRLGAILAGAGGGAAVGAAAGAYAGSGTGLAFGGVGAIPGWIAGTVVGGVGGAVVGGLGGALFWDSRVKCPHCGRVFKPAKEQEQLAQ